MIIDFDGSPHGGYPALAKEECADIKSGIGKLFIETKFTDDGIALPYSVASIYCGELVGVNHKGDLYNHKNIVQELGFQHTTLSTAQIAQRDLQKRGFKLLFLPAVICLSDDTIAAITEFVRKGGVVVADYAAALRDEHGKKRDKDPVARLFGIDRSGIVGESRKMTVTFTGSAPGPIRGLHAEMKPG